MSCSLQAAKLSIILPLYHLLWEIINQIVLQIKNILNLTNKSGNTLLHIAAKNNCIEIIINVLVFISAYEIDIDDVEVKKKLSDYLFEKHKNNFEWIDRVDNGFYISYESSNDSIQGIYAYSLGTTISFTSNEIRQAETKIRFPNL